MGPNGENLADEVEKVPSASEGSLSPTRWVQKHNCPMPPLGPIPFTNLRLQSEYPGFKMDIGLNHVRVGQASEGEGFFARLDCSDGERNDKEDMHVSNKWGPKHLAQQLLESDVVGPSTGAGGRMGTDACRRWIKMRMSILLNSLQMRWGKVIKNP